MIPDQTSNQLIINFDVDKDRDLIHFLKGYPSEKIQEMIKIFLREKIKKNSYIGK